MPLFARRYAEIGHPDLMVGIPVYAPEAGLHDYVVQATGAFEETIHGILNLSALGQRVMGLEMTAWPGPTPVRSGSTPPTIRVS